MKKTLAAIVLLFVTLVAMFVYEASAQFLTLGVSGSTDGGGPGTCSNSLDFTDACNSQYIAVIF